MSFRWFRWGVLNGSALAPIAAVAVALAVGCADRAHIPANAMDGGTGGPGGTGLTGGVAGATGGAPRQTDPPDASGGSDAAAGTGGTIGGNGGAAGMGTGGATSNLHGPCDIYLDAGQPCVAAYSTVRRLLSTYTGPLYQIRIGSSDQNTGSGGETLDIGQTADGFADAAAVDAACAGTICTVSLLYDQSGRESHLAVAKAGIPFGGSSAALDDFESDATKERLTVGGHTVYPLFMEPRQGYRLARRGDGMPRAMEPQGIYMLADGMRAGIGCCWEFGNGPPNAQTFNDPTALFYGSGVGTVGAGDGPWFMADLGVTLWAGNAEGTATPQANPNNPSLTGNFALGFLKTDPRGSAIAMPNWALRMADVTTADGVTTAYRGVMPRPAYQSGSVLLGINGYNSNDAWGTFYEGAIVAGFPADDTELSVLRNIQAVGYGRF